ncbi:MAG: tetraacyldisaccharide 4'-kinase [Flavobacteriales bacterium]|nr:tetraacyldisaccharide 4'-kinase [Flavobacteriales bacterium]
MQLVLYPFSVLYAIVTNLRNLLFDMGIFPSKTFDIPIICIGNLSVGGTGKTPLTDYIITLLKNEKNIAVLSRGYGRNTSGFQEVSTESTAKKVGDESLLIKQKHPNCLVVVDENRKRGIENIMKKHPEIELILLDDGFQHRWVKAGFNILITDYSLPYYKDYLLPMGTLRESKESSKRAEIIVVSKSPKDINPTEKKGIIQQLGVFITQKCYFSHINYKSWKCITTNKDFLVEEKYSITLVTGIANASTLVENLKNNNHTVSHLEYADHHNYTLNDIEDILNKYNQDNSTKKLILTTEKDAVKLRKFENKFGDANIYFAPIETGFEEKENFEKQILNYVTANKRNS